MTRGVSHVILNVTSPGKLIATVVKTSHLVVLTMRQAAGLKAVLG